MRREGFGLCFDIDRSLNLYYHSRLKEYMKKLYSFQPVIDEIKHLTKGDSDESIQ